MTIKYLRNLTSAGGGTGGGTGITPQYVLKANFTNAVTAKVGTSRYYPPAQMNIIQIYASIGTPATTVVSVDIKVNNASILGSNLLTIPANQNISTRRTVAISVLAASYITVDVVAGGGSDLVVYMVYENAETTSATPAPAPAPSPSTDSNFRFTVLSLSGIGSNSSTNNSIVDSSSNAFTVSRVGNVTQGSFSPFSTAAGYWSVYFNGTTDYLTIPSSSNLVFGVGDFTVEMWVFQSSLAQAGLLSNSASSSGGDAQFELQIAPGTFYPTLLGWGTAFLTSNTAITANTWNHIAVSRNGTSMAMWLNGSRVATNTSGNNFSSTNSFNIGRQAASNGTFFNGYISNLKMVRGTSVYSPSSASITVPTAPLTTSTNTQVLTLQNNRFIDSSTNAFSLTSFGAVEISPFSPFTPTTTTYSSSTMGGSMYFDGTGDWISFNNITVNSSQSFCCEAWIYPVGSQDTLVFGGPNDAGGAAENVQLAISSNGGIGGYFGGYFFSGSSSTWTVGSSLRFNSWNHVAWTRSSSTNRLFINGTLITTTSGDSSGLFARLGGVGQDGAGNTYKLFRGYISNARIVVGDPVYTASFTPPTQPVTAIANTSLLLNGTNGRIVDATAKNVIETVGTAQISTAVNGTGALYFDGSGHLALPANDLFAFGTGDFTIEFWMNSSDISGTTQRGPLQISSTPGGFSTTYTTGVAILQGGTRTNSPLSGALSVVIGSTTVGSATAVLTANTWQHIAIVRAGGSATLFVGGAVVDARTANSNLAGTNLVIGGYYNNSYRMQGHIQDLRILKGIAKYSAAFTPPTRSTS